jgi:hypothetical protein
MWLCSVTWCVAVLVAPVLAMMVMSDRTAGRTIWPLFGWMTTVLVITCLFANALRTLEPNPATFPFYRIVIGLWLGGLVFPVLMLFLMKFVTG